MTHDSEDRLAPVSYLPWATPVSDHPAGRRPVGDANTDSGDAVAEEPDGMVAETGDAAAEDSATGEAAVAIRGSGRSGRWSREGARGGMNGRRGGSGSSRLSVVDDDDDLPDETGAERDDRIDRLVISRLRRSALSIAEVRAVLAEHGLDEAEVDEWIERYERLGYLDDARLAEQLAHSHGTRRGRGSGAILHELERRGIGGDVARDAVGGLDADAELANATAVAERRARQLTGLDHATAERRLTAFLLRRGYPSSVAREAVTAALSVDGS